MILIWGPATGLGPASRHPTNSGAIRGSPAGPPIKTRLRRWVEAAGPKRLGGSSRRECAVRAGLGWVDNGPATGLEPASRHPTNGGAIRGNPAGPLIKTRLRRGGGGSGSEETGRALPARMRRTSVFALGRKPRRKAEFISAAQVKWAAGPQIKNTSLKGWCF